MAATPEAASPLNLWLTDRSRYFTGLSRCPRERYLKNHFGPTGYGIVRKADSLPLATGSYLHQAFESILGHLREFDAIPDASLIRESIRVATSAYEKRIEARGYRGILASESVERVVTEQNCLITGLVWAFCRTILPWLHTHYRLLQVETESIYVLACTCGLTPTDPAEQHDARNCNGIGQMLRQDCVAEKRAGGGLAYFEIKSTGWAADTWSQQWETKPQLALGSLGLQERFGKELSESFIVGCYKGRRTTRGEGSEAQVIQDSPFCYGYCKPGNPPLATDDWKPAYRYTDTTTGEVKQVSRQHQKRGVWELPQSDWLPAKHMQVPPAEWWAHYLPEDVLKQQIFLVGPLNRQDEQIAMLKRQVPAEEQRWKRILWDLFEGSHEWSSPEFQAKLDELVPCSFDCRRFGTKHECEMVPICFKKAGWEDPLGSGHYVPRRPHHTPELEQAVGRGLLPVEAEEGEESDHE